MILSNGEFRVVFVAKDYKASIDFYGGVLQLPVHHDWNFGETDCGSVFHCGTGLVEVLGGLPGSDYAAPVGPWVSMQVDDVDAMYDHVLKAGVKIVDEPKDYPWGQRILKVADPDGLLIWLFAPVAAE